MQPSLNQQSEFTTAMTAWSKLCLWLLVAVMLFSSGLRDAGAMSGVVSQEAHAMSAEMVMAEMPPHCEDSACDEMSDCELKCALNATAAPVLLPVSSIELHALPVHRRLPYSPGASAPLSRRSDTILRPPIA